MPINLAIVTSQEPNMFSSNYKDTILMESDEKNINNSNKLFPNIISLDRGQLQIPLPVLQNIGSLGQIDPTTYQAYKSKRSLSQHGRKTKLNTSNEKSQEDELTSNTRREADTTLSHVKISASRNSVNKSFNGLFTGMQNRGGSMQK